jgi:hypothetical protein
MTQLVIGNINFVLTFYYAVQCSAQVVWIGIAEINCAVEGHLASGNPVFALMFCSSCGNETIYPEPNTGLHQRHLENIALVACR